MNRSSKRRDDEAEVFPIDEEQQRAQVERVRALKTRRDNEAVRIAALEDLRRAARGPQNLLYPMKSGAVATGDARRGGRCPARGVRNLHARLTSSAEVRPSTSPRPRWRTRRLRCRGMADASEVHINWHCAPLASAEHCTLSTDGDGYRFVGVVVTLLGDVPCHVEYSLVVDRRWCTRMSATPRLPRHWVVARSRSSHAPLGDGTSMALRCPSSWIATTSTSLDPVHEHDSHPPARARAR